MKVVDSNEALQLALEQHKSGQYQQAAHVYNQILNHDPSNATALYLMGDLQVRMGNNGVAINLLSNSVAAQPQAPSFIALGCALKAEHFNKEAEEAWLEAIKLQPTTEAYNNLASLHSDSGEPEKALPYIDKALELEPSNPNARWNRALSLLTMRRWKEAWLEHEHRFNPAVQQVSKPRDFGAPAWDGKPTRKLAVHGEQGIGDEIMFLSVLHEALERCDDVVVEVEPRLMDIVERSFPRVRAYANEAAMKAHETGFTAQIALGSLPRLFRNDDLEFPRHVQYLVADQERVDYWRNKFRTLGDGPIIGVAWAGGTKSTRAHQRTMDASALKFCTKGVAISLQYGIGADKHAEEAGFHYFPESDGSNMEEVFAMASACDVLITAAQTLVHVGGALGKPTYVLTPLRSSWRYGRGNEMLWYGKHVHLLRQHRDGDWSHPLKRAEQVVDALCKGVAV